MLASILVAVVVLVEPRRRQIVVFSRALALVFWLVVSRALALVFWLLSACILLYLSSSLCFGSFPFEESR